MKKKLIQLSSPSRPQPLPLLSHHHHPSKPSPTLAEQTLAHHRIPPNLPFLSCNQALFQVSRRESCPPSGNPKMAWRQILFSTRAILEPYSTTGSAKFSTKSNPYLVKVGIPEFLNGIGNGVESHVSKLESEIGDFQKLLVTRTLKLKKLGIPCKHRKLILKYTHKYRLGLWRPRAQAVKS
ncbi:unnamed protein product [Prunus armeniaca]|uniref:Small ribosomal subunit protein mS41 SAM domain-containing protein n=4 Tax=Prunus TaxID=3754 RepID=A0A6J5U7Z9_PRUAR|nr:unnamed protein product [Prunus armeniaca]CAB4303060.1 unnamed protein product [Prunus armeniaca]